MDYQSTVDTTPPNTMQASQVMVIDDDVDWVFICARMLKKAGLQNNIIQARNGLDALRILQERAQQRAPLPEVMLLDIKMPVMDGFELLQEIMQSQEIDLSHTKIYMCSSSAKSSDQEKASSFSIAGFLRKPLTVPQLQEVLRK